jgi:hypothetical protein
MSNADVAVMIRGIRGGGAPSASRQILRLALFEGEVIRLPKSYTRMYVLAGTAWITAGGRDIVLGSGDDGELPASRDPVVVSGVGCEGLVFEVW